MKKFIVKTVATLAAVSMLAVPTFATGISFGTSTSKDNDVNISDLSFCDRVVVTDANGCEKGVIVANESNVSTLSLFDEENTNFEPGDNLYFALKTKDNELYTGSIDKDWRIDTRSDYHVGKVEFYSDDGDLSGVESAKGVKVSFIKSFNKMKAEKGKFLMRLSDKEHRNTYTHEVQMTYDFDMPNEEVDFDAMNQVYDVRRWESKTESKDTAVFNFNNDVSFVVPMVSKEKVIFDYTNDDVFGIEKKYNYDYDMSFINFLGDNDTFVKKGTLFIDSKEDNKFIYEVINNKLVKSNAKYVTNFNEINGFRNKGYVITTNSLGNYVLSNKEIPLVEEDKKEETIKPVKPTEKDPVETEKPITPTTDNKPVTPNKVNPDTGVEDYTKLAVSLLAISGFGCLALIKNK